MTKIVWTDNALHDIFQIYSYIALDSPVNAGAFTDRLMDSAEKQLNVSPTIGRIVPEIQDPAIREIIYEKYRVMYHFEDDVVSITHVRHGARDFSKVE